MVFEEGDIAKIALLLSAERLTTLTRLTGSTSKAIELHQETLSVGASLMNVTATVEIALRNTVCENLGQYFVVPNWLFRPPIPFEWKAMERGKITKALDNAKRAKYSKLSQQEKGNLDQRAYPNGRPPNTSHQRRAKDRRRQIRVSDGSVIAELTMHFWKRLYGPDYDQTLWRTTLKRTFPNKKLSRADVADKLEVIYQSRNRLAHHEPVLHKRLDDTLASIQFIIENMGMESATPDSALAKLVTRDMEEVSSKAKAIHTKLASYCVQQT